MNREMRQAWKRDMKRRKAQRRGTNMLAKAKWQVKTIQALEKVFEERLRQHEKHGDAMLHLEDGTGPDEFWLRPLIDLEASQVQVAFREDYDERRGDACAPSERLTRMHLVREELAEAFEQDGDSPEFLEEIIQVAALCVQWAEYKMESPR